MSDSLITFFMLVTDRDIVIADYSVNSYAKIQGLEFKLRVYSNWVSSGLKRKYFPGWRKLPFVEIVENEWQTDENKPSSRKLDGPFELYDNLWDRELKKIATTYHATVDADFEILDARFIPVMLKQLQSDPGLVAMSTDYSPTAPETYDSYSNEVIRLNERWHTWFCIYKREALECTVSHAYYEEVIDGPVRRNAWDSAAYFQKALQDIHGYRLATLDPSYQPCFIHYGAFGQNRHVTAQNVALYRRLQIVRKKGFFGTPSGLAAKVAGRLNRMFFGDVNRATYVEGWGKR